VLAWSSTARAVGARCRLVCSVGCTMVRNARGTRCGRCRSRTDGRALRARASLYRWAGSPSSVVRGGGTKAPKGQVLLGFPTARQDTRTSWPGRRSIACTIRSLPEGTQGTAAYARTTRKGFGVLASLSFDLSPAPQATPANLVAARQAIEDWGVTRIVVRSMRCSPGWSPPRPALRGGVLHRCHR